jgi:WD40 repeat protein
MTRQIILIGLILIWSSIASADNYLGWHLVDTIALNGENMDILNITTDGQNLIVLSNGQNGNNDEIVQFNLSGERIGNTYSTETGYTSAITWNGQKLVIAKGSAANTNKLYEMDLRTGQISDAFTGSLGFVTGLGFNGNDILVNGSGGCSFYNSSYSYNGTPLYYNAQAGQYVGLTWNVGPAYDMDYHNGDLYIHSAIYGFQVFHLTDNSHAELLGAMNTYIPNPRGIAFIGNDMYIGDRGKNVIYHYEVPEPATILLFTLGGMILRRKH